MSGIAPRYALLSAALVLGLSHSASAQVARLDELQFRGGWYEISHIPDKREKPCVHDTMLLVARGDKTHQMQFGGTCTQKNGETLTWSFVAAPARHHDDGRLHIPFLWLLHRNLYVYALDPAAGWCVLGTPNHKQLWIYSLKPTLAPDALSQAQGVASTAGFSTGKLVASPQAPLPEPSQTGTASASSSTD